MCQIAIYCHCHKYAVKWRRCCVNRVNSQPIIFKSCSVKSKQNASQRGNSPLHRDKSGHYDILCVHNGKSVNRGVWYGFTVERFLKKDMGEIQ